MNVTKGPGDLPPFEPEESFWDDEEWVGLQVTVLRKEWVDKIQEILVHYLYYRDLRDVQQDLDELVDGLTEKIEERAEASRYPEA